MVISLYALCLGFLLDLIFGDPHWLPHPVRLMGRAISGLEKALRPRFPVPADFSLFTPGSGDGDVLSAFGRQKSAGREYEGV